MSLTTSRTKSSFVSRPITACTAKFQSLPCANTKTSGSSVRSIKEQKIICKLHIPRGETGRSAVKGTAFPYPREGAHSTKTITGLLIRERIRPRPSRTNRIPQKLETEWRIKKAATAAGRSHDRPACTPRNHEPSPKWELDDRISSAGEPNGTTRFDIRGNGRFSFNDRRNLTSLLLTEFWTSHICSLF